MGGHSDKRLFLAAICLLFVLSLAGLPLVFQQLGKGGHGPVTRVYTTAVHSDDAFVPCAPGLRCENCVEENGTRACMKGMCSAEGDCITEGA